MSMEVGKIHATLGLDSGEFNKGLVQAKVAMAGTAAGIEKVGNATEGTTTKVKALTVALKAIGTAATTLVYLAAIATMAVGGLQLAFVKLAAEHQKMRAEMEGGDVGNTLLGKMQALGDKIRDIMTAIGYRILPKIEPMITQISKALDYWPEVWAAAELYMNYVQFALEKIRDLLVQIWPLVQAFGKWVMGIELGGMDGLIARWRELANEIRNTYEHNAWWRRQVNKENIEKLKKEADAVFEVVKAEKEAAEAHAERRRQEVGWMDLRDLYRKAQVAAVRGSVSAAPSATLTPQNIPGTERLREIRDTLRKQETQNEEMLKIIRERLGVYA